jgi:hypothetical protein
LTHWGTHLIETSLTAFHPLASATGILAAVLDQWLFVGSALLSTFIGPSLHQCTHSHPPNRNQQRLLSYGFRDREKW